MAYNLFLDSMHSPVEISEITISEKDKKRYQNYRWVIAKSYNEFISIIKKKGLPGLVSFDHDLSPEHWDLMHSKDNCIKINDVIIIDYDVFEIKTGYHAVEWLLEYCNNTSSNIPIILVHAQNLLGKKNIENLLF